MPSIEGIRRGGMLDRRRHLHRGRPLTAVNFAADDGEPTYIYFQTPVVVESQSLISWSARIRWKHVCKQHSESFTMNAVDAVRSGTADSSR